MCVYWCGRTLSQQLSALFHLISWRLKCYRIVYVAGDVYSIHSQLNECANSVGLDIHGMTESVKRRQFKGLDKSVKSDFCAVRRTFKLFNTCARMCGKGARARLINKGAHQRRNFHPKVINTHFNRSTHCYRDWREIIVNLAEQISHQNSG